jgi:ceramide synthetase
MHVTMTTNGLLSLDTSLDPSGLLMTSSYNDVYGASLQLYYRTQLGLWLAFLYEFMAFTPPQQDKYVMGAHHVATISAIVASNNNTLRPLGALIMLIHDASDIPVMLLKIVSKFQFPEAVVSVSYVVCLTTWVYARLYLFGWTIAIQSVWGDHILPPSANPSLALRVAGVCLLALTCMHTWWAGLILQLPFKERSKWKEYEGSIEVHHS